jgi:hypothetical protein
MKLVIQFTLVPWITGVGFAIALSLVRALTIGEHADNQVHFHAFGFYWVVTYFMIALAIAASLFIAAICAIFLSHRVVTLIR